MWWFCPNFKIQACLTFFPFKPPTKEKVLSTFPSIWLTVPPLNPSYVVSLSCLGYHLISFYLLLLQASSVRLLILEPCLKEVFSHVITCYPFDFSMSTIYKIYQVTSYTAEQLIVKFALHQSGLQNNFWPENLEDGHLHIGAVRVDRAGRNEWPATAVTGSYVWCFGQCNHLRAKMTHSEY